MWRAGWRNSSWPSPCWLNVLRVRTESWAASSPATNCLLKQDSKECWFECWIHVTHWHVRKCRRKWRPVLDLYTSQLLDRKTIHINQIETDHFFLLCLADWCSPVWSTEKSNSQTTFTSDNILGPVSTYGCFLSNSCQCEAKASSLGTIRPAQVFRKIKATAPVLLNMYKMET